MVSAASHILRLGTDMLYSVLENGFFHPERHANSMPTDAKPISDARYGELIEQLKNGGSLSADENGDPVVTYGPPKTLQELAAAAMAQVNAEYTRRMGAIADDYPLHERESWPVQLQEARELQSDPDAVTPWIDLCAAQRGMTREELAGRIVAKDLAYREVSGFLTGVRQKHEDEIAALLAAGEESREALQDYWYMEGWDIEQEPASEDQPEEEAGQ